MKKIKYALAAFVFALWQSLYAVCPAAAAGVSPATGDEMPKYIIIGAVVCTVLLIVVVLMGKKRK